MDATAVFHHSHAVSTYVDVLREAGHHIEISVKDDLRFHFLRPSVLLSELPPLGVVIKASSNFSRLLSGHTDWVWSVAFSPDGKLLASASSDKTVRLWNVPSGNLYGELEGHSLGVTAVTFSPDGLYIATGGKDATVRTWSLDLKEFRVLSRHTGIVNAVAWSPNSKLIASGSDDRTVILWQTNTVLPFKILVADTTSIMSLAFYKDGQRLMTGTYRWVFIWNIDTETILHTFTYPCGVWSSCFSRDEKFLLVACHDSTIRMFEVETGLEAKRFTGHTHYARSAVFANDDTLIVSGAGDDSVRLWDVESIKQLPQMGMHDNTVWSIAVSADNKYFASGSADKNIRLWNAPVIIHGSSALPEEQKEEEQKEEPVEPK